MLFLPCVVIDNCPGNYWIVNQILSKGLHNADQESLAYTTTLMDRLEQFKEQHAGEAAVMDDVAGKAYVEQFGLDTFARADNAVRANKASRQTADTFQASATFLDLMQIWGDIDPEFSSKIKYAKYHALRIAKAVKAGEDPNASNPAPEPEVDESLPALDPDDPEVQMLQGGKPRQPSVTDAPDDADREQRNLAKVSSLDQTLPTSQDPAQDQSLQRQASVVEAPDESDRVQRSLAAQSSLDESLHPSRAPSVPRQPQNDVSPLQDPTTFYTNQDGKADISPLNSDERKSSIGGNYFPQVPSPTAIDPTQSLPEAGTALDQPSDVTLPSAPTEPSLPPPPTSIGTPPRQPPPAPTNHHGRFLPQPGDPAQTGAIPPNLPPQSTSRTPTSERQQRGSHGPVPPVPSARGSLSSVSSSQQPIVAPMAVATAPVVVDEEKIMSAQKHARWAISALNFEDVPTAIKELRAALGDLGG
jgi:vacuolar protein sorting-associated protein VTA1